jgi:ADP-ribose pyrophosphatase
VKVPKIGIRREVFATPYFTLVGKGLAGDDRGDPFYSLEMADYVVVVAATPNGDLVLVRQFRPAVEALTIELPAGHVEAGQTPEEAARRELLEETGFAAGRVTLLGRLRPDTGRLANHMWVFVALGVEAQPGHVGEAGIEVLTATPSELARLLAEGAFDHALHVAALLMAVQRGCVALPATEGNAT